MMLYYWVQICGRLPVWPIACVLVILQSCGLFTCDVMKVKAHAVTCLPLGYQNADPSHQYVTVSECHGLPYCNLILK